MTEKFDRVNFILKNKEYKLLLKKLEQLEKDRKFCCHNLEHFLDTARIMYIISFEENFFISKDLVYAAALLHDIGRVLQYEKNIFHEVASADFAEKILSECGFDNNEIEQITNAIKNHRKGLSEKNNNVLAYLLYRADKLSRMCFNCKAQKDCYWDDSKKNLKILY